MTALDANQPPPPIADRPRAVTPRSLIVGLLGVVLICGVSPVNDILFSDSNLTAGYLPLSLVLLEFVLIVGINAPLHRFAPRLALRGGELGVVILMGLVACSLPSWGLTRFLVPTPVAPFFLGKEDQTFWRAFEAMKLSPWLWPVASVHEGRGAPVVEGFYYGLSDGEHIPWSAWVRPLISWGVFAAATFAALASLGRLVYDQWAHNERLPFPLVQVQAALIEPPEEGRALNALFRSWSLWITMALVMAVHGLTMLHAYSPRHFNALSPGYNLTSLFTEPPLFYVRDKVKAATISFIVVGATYFIRSRAALSLWLIYLLINVVDVRVQSGGGAVSDGMWADQHFGACAAFVCGMIFVGRSHWLTVLRNAVGLGRGADAADRSRYRGSFWTFVVGVVVMAGWLCWAGVTPWLAAVIVAIILVSHVIVSRVVAETGLPFFRTGIATSQVYTNLSIARVSATDVYFSGVTNLLGPLATRDGVTGLTMQGLGVAESQADVDRERRRICGAVVLALVVGFAVAVAVTMYCHYSYPTPTDRSVVPQGNNFGGVYAPMRDVRNPVDEYVNSQPSGRFTPKGHNSLAHMGIGFGIVTFLEVMALRVAWWPLLPIGFVASFGAFIQNAWFSIFVGWLAKVLIVRFGGAALYNRARPVFVGLIFGESLIAAVWLIVNVFVVMAGGTSQKVTFML